MPKRKKTIPPKTENVHRHTRQLAWERICLSCQNFSGTHCTFMGIAIAAVDTCPSYSVNPVYLIKKKSYD